MTQEVKTVQTVNQRVFKENTKGRYQNKKEIKHSNIPQYRMD